MKNKIRDFFRFLALFFLLALELLEQGSDWIFNLGMNFLVPWGIVFAFPPHYLKIATLVGIMFVINFLMRNPIGKFMYRSYVSLIARIWDDIYTEFLNLRGNQDRKVLLPASISGLIARFILDVQKETGNRFFERLPEQWEDENSEE